MKNKVVSLKICILFIACLFNDLIAQPGNLPNPYCMPLYSQSPCNNPGPSNMPGNFVNDFINSVMTIGGNVNINNLNSGCNTQNFTSIGLRNYIYHKCQHNLSVTAGQVVTFSVQIGQIFSEGVALFIDWNSDNIFQTPGEMVAATPGVISGGSWATLSVTVPSLQPNGIYRLRVRCALNTVGTTINPCNNYSSGEVEDYDVYVGTASPVITGLANSNSTLCSGNTLSLNLTYTSQCTPSFTWTGPNSFISNSQNPTIANAQPSTSGIYSVTASCGPCPINLTTSVTVNQSPTAANAGPSMTLCSMNTTTFMAGNIPSIGFGTWSVVSGSANFLQVNQANTGTTFLPPNPYNVLAWTTSNQGCTSTSTMSVTFFTPTIANAGPSQSLCMQTTATLNGNTPSVGTGSWSVVSGTATITSPTSPTTNVTSLGIGTTVFKWTLSSGYCSPSASQMTITNFVMPTITVVSSPSAVCSNSSATLTANGALNYNWFPSGSGSLIVVTPSVQTTYTIIGNNGPCFANDTITVYMSPGPTPAVAGPTQCGCATTATLNGNTPSVGTGTWSLISGVGTITNPNSPNSGVTGLGIGVNVFQWAISFNNCVSTSTTAIIRTANPTVSNAGPNQTVVCASSATMAGNTPAIGTGTWTVVSGSGTFVSPNLPNSSVNGVGVGLNIYQWAIGNNSLCSCQPVSTSTMSVFNTNSISVSAVANPTAVCSNFNSTLTASGANSYTWTGSTFTGNIIQPTVAINSGTYNVIGSAGSCTNSASIVVYTMSPPILTVTANNYTFCPPGHIQLSASGATNYFWSPCAGILNVCFGSPVWCQINTSMIFTVTGTVPGCSSNGTVMLTAIPNPTITATTNQSLICAGDPATLTATGGLNYTWTPSGSGSVTVVNPTVTTTYSVYGTSTNVCVGTGTVTQNVSPCTSLFEGMELIDQIKISPNPFNDELTFQTSKDLTISIFDMTGKLMIERKIMKGDKVNTSNWSKGVYIIYIEGAEGRNAYKLIKE